RARQAPAEGEGGDNARLVGWIEVVDKKRNRRDEILLHDAAIDEAISVRQSRYVGRGGLRQPRRRRYVELALHQLFDQVAAELRMARIGLRGLAVMVRLGDLDAGRPPLLLLFRERDVVDDFAENHHRGVTLGLLEHLDLS